MKTIAPVDVFSVHEKLGIEQANFFERAVPHQHEPAVQHLNRHRRLMIKVRHQISPKQLGFLERNIEAQGAAELVPHRRKTHSRPPHLAVAAEHFWPYHTDLWI